MTVFFCRAFGLGYDLMLRLTNGVTKDEDKEDNERRRLCSICIGCSTDNNLASIVCWLCPV